MAAPQEILDFWFNPKLSLKELGTLWFAGTKPIDQEIADRFGKDVEAAAEGRLSSWEAEPRSCLALILLLDQFSLNIYRGKPRSFLVNDLGLPITLRALEKNFHRQATSLERVFFYLPLEHAENLNYQNRAVELFRQLIQDANFDEKEMMKGFYHFAVLHQEVIQRFGRFPNRNEVLERPSTPEEEKYLKEEGSPF
jgi:uncharacterized protein (DUF924 family)